MSKVSWSMGSIEYERGICSVWDEDEEEVYRKGEREEVG